VAFIEGNCFGCKPQELRWGGGVRLCEDLYPGLQRPNSSRKNAERCHSEARCVPRNLSFLGFQPKRDSSLRSEWQRTGLFPQAVRRPASWASRRGWWFGFAHHKSRDLHWSRLVSPARRAWERELNLLPTWKFGCWANFT